MDFYQSYSSLISQIGEFALLLPLSKTMRQVITGLAQPSVAPKSPTIHNCTEVNKHVASDGLCLVECLLTETSFVCITQSMIQGVRE